MSAYSRADGFRAGPTGPDSNFNLKYLPLFPSSFIFAVNALTDNAFV